MSGRTAEALAAYRTAARLTTSLPEQRYLNARAALLL
jgi:predicted RNA polymerase sigma factor